MILYDNGQFIVSHEGDDVYIEVQRPGATVQDFQTVVAVTPRIKLTAFAALKNAFTAADGKRRRIGHLRPPIEIQVSSDGMVAKAQLNLTQSQIDENEREVISGILKALEDKGVTTGVIKNALAGPFTAGEQLKVAEGIYPVPGQDATCRYYELGEKKPEILDDGKADHYELNLIHNVQKGDWLGEKIHVVEGKPGKTVFGEDIPPKTGKDKALRYDAKTVDAIVQDNRTILKAKADGAVAFKSGKITVDNHLYIHGDVDYKTGNVKFDGNVTITGIVKDKFSVVATGDIAIRGETGIGAVTMIQSTGGSVYVRGGINGRNVGVIKAEHDIFVKYVNEAQLIAKREINVGLYAIDSTLEADKVMVSPQKGRIIGGNIKAGHQIVAGSIGNAQERRTRVSVDGFAREEIGDQLKAVKISFEMIIGKANKAKRQIEIFEANFDQLDEKAMNTYRAMLVQYDTLIDEINRMNREVQRLEDMLRTRGEGEVKIQAGVYPKTMLEIKKMQKFVTELMSCSFYAKGTQLHTVSE